MCHRRRRSLSRCILAARTYGLRCLDGVHLDMTDAEGFERACRQGRDMGMDGKTLIHPSTVREPWLSLATMCVPLRVDGRPLPSDQLQAYYYDVDSTTDAGSVWK